MLVLILIGKHGNYPLFQVGNFEENSSDNNENLLTGYLLMVGGEGINNLVFKKEETLCGFPTLVEALTYLESVIEKPE